MRCRVHRNLPNERDTTESPTFCAFTSGETKRDATQFCSTRSTRYPVRLLGTISLKGPQRDSGLIVRKRGTLRWEDQKVRRSKLHSQLSSPYTDYPYQTDSRFKT